MSAPTPIDQNKLEKLKRWIEDIVFDEIMPLINTRQVIISFVEAIQVRPAEANDLIAALKFTYISTIVLTICRQTDIDDQSKSLARIMHEMTWDPKAADDLRSLLESSAEIRTYRDKRIAHMDKGKFTSSLTFNDANKVIEQLVMLTRRYYLKLHGSDFVIQPTAEEGWRKIIHC